MSNFLVIFFSLFLGYILQKKYRHSHRLPHYLNKFIIYIALPAMILLEVPKLSFSDELFIPMTISWVVMISSALLVLLFSFWLHFKTEITGALMLVAVLTNSTFLGIPIIHAYYGSAALPYIIVYDQIGSFLFLSTYGTIIVAIYAHKSKINLAIILTKIITFPPFIALLLALLPLEYEFDTFVTQLLKVLSLSIPPLALIAVGLQLRFRLPKDDLIPFSIALLIKLIIAPMIAILTAYIFDWNGIATQVSIMEAGMAPMITAAAMASMVGLAPRLSAAITGYGILFSFVTSAILYLLIR